MTARKAKTEKKQEQTLEEAYDEFPYESYVYPSSHPDRMFANARLFKLNPPDFKTARILEIGGAAGGNLIPFAMAYPQSQCLGVDISGEQIAQAEKGRKAMNLKNLEFRQMDITKFPKNAGEFDYIVCHGVFSWVPPAVQDAILDVCERHLSKDGYAGVSYNVLPGWGAVKSLREMMMYHTAPFQDPAQKIAESKKLLNFLYENTPQGDEGYKQIIEREREILSKTNDSYVFHEHLEIENHQFYLHEFVRRAAERKLGYVGDAELSTMYLGNFSEKAQSTLSQIKDIVRLEQYLDFLTNRRFRQTILTRAENAVKANRNINHEDIFKFYVAAKFQPEAAAPDASGCLRFKMPESPANFMTHDKDSSLVFQALAQEGRPVKVDDLARTLRERAGIDPEYTRAVFLQHGFPLTFQGFITINADTCEFARGVSAKPVAHPWSRYLAGGQKITSGLTNAKRETVKVNPMQARLLPHLDGTNDRAALIGALTVHALNGGFNVNRDGVKVTNEADVRAIIDHMIDGALQSLADNAFLIG